MMPTAIHSIDTCHIIHNVLWSYSVEFMYTNDQLTRS